MYLLKETRVWVQHTGIYQDVLFWNTKHIDFFLKQHTKLQRKVVKVNRTENTSKINDFTCFWAAKMTFMKFMYWRAQSSAAFITYPVKYKVYVQNHGNETWALVKLDHLGLTNILDFISCPTKKEKPTISTERRNRTHWRALKLNNKNIWLPSKSFETLWISEHQGLKKTP